MRLDNEADWIDLLRIVEEKKDEHSKSRRGFSSYSEVLVEFTKMDHGDDKDISGISRKIGASELFEFKQFECWVPGPVDFIRVKPQFRRIVSLILDQEERLRKLERTSLHHEPAR